MFSTTDTIVAIATPAGRGGLGVVRLSGPAAHDIARALLGRARPLDARRATFGKLRESDGGDASTLDDVVATWFQAPRSYTREDVVEIAAHGSPIVLQGIVERAIDAGARLAEPGEFTLRAYLNGRLDLVQAEAVGDLIDAVTPAQARVAMDQIEGTLTSALARVEARLFDLSARLEASLDFPDEDFHFITRDEVRADVAAARADLSRLTSEGRAGRLIREGALVVIAGRPNAGKSTLFNALAGAARAIVTEMPGTTRDLLTERVDIGGLAVTLVDTAGLRDAENAIEAEGVSRARQALSVAALRLWVVDGSTADAADLDVAADGDDTLVVVNKTDLRPRGVGDDARRWPEGSIRLSARTGDGLDELRRAIRARLTGRDDWRDSPSISNVRHLGHVEDAQAALARVEQALEAGATEELLLAELSHARQALEAIAGRRSADDLLHRIFARFCIGK